MRASVTLIGTLLVVFGIAVPAFALEDGIVETSSVTPGEDLAHADFERTITNISEVPIDIAPRDLRVPEYPIMTVVTITAGTFDGGIWSIGTLEPGQTAAITYAGSVAPAATTAPEELPYTGRWDHLSVFAIAGLGLIGLGVSLLRATRD